MQSPKMFTFGVKESNRRLKENAVELVDK